MAIEEAIVLIKTSFHQNASTRKLIRILLTVSKALPIISNSVKIRAGNGAPVNSNPSYARARLQTVSNEATLTGASKLQSLVDSAQSLVDSTPSRKSSRKRAVVTPDRDSLPPDLPEPLNGKYYSVIEAVAKFKACPKKKRGILLSEWKSRKWVPNYSKSWWYRTQKKLESGESIREWKEGGKSKMGRTAYVDVDELCELIESTGNGKALGSDEIESIIEQTQRR